MARRIESRASHLEEVELDDFLEFRTVVWLRNVCRWVHGPPTFTVPLSDLLNYSESRFAFRIPMLPLPRSHSKREPRESQITSHAHRLRHQRRSAVFLWDT